MDDTVAIVVAAGRGERLGVGTPKAFVELGGRPMLALTADAVARSRRVSRLIVAVPPGSEEAARDLLGSIGAVTVVAGGATRHGSVAAALAVLGQARLVVCHDAARPFATPALFSSVLAGLDRWDGVVPAIPVPDTVKRVRAGTVERTEPRQELVLAQTPQAFRAEVLAEAHRRAASEAMTFSDDAACVEWAGYSVAVVDGEQDNFKITTAADLERAESVLARAARG